MTPRQRPIIFSGPMVRAILDGRKSQTRRILKPQPTEPESIDYAAVVVDHNDVVQRALYCCMRQINVRDWPEKKPAYWKEYAELPYRPGDLLWVRETWSAPYRYCDLRPRDRGGPFWYWADGNPGFGDWCRPTPSIHMPFFAARIWLRVTNVRVQRVQEISEDDARAEGCRGNATTEWGCEGLIEDFADLWNVLNAKRGFGWDENPWVAAYTFERVEKP